MQGIDISAGAELPDDLLPFLLSFEKAVFKQNMGKLTSFIDIDYKKEQLGNLNGNKEQFIKEMFCGNELTKEGFTCIALDHIDALRLINLKTLNKQIYLATYEVKSDTTAISVEWELRRSKNNIHGYGFIGAYG